MSIRIKYQNKICLNKILSIYRGFYYDTIKNNQFHLIELYDVKKWRQTFSSYNEDVGMFHVPDFLINLEKQ